MDREGMTVVTGCNIVLWLLLVMYIDKQKTHTTSEENKIMTAKKTMHEVKTSF